MSTAKIASVLAESKETDANNAEQVTLPSYSKLMARVESETTRAYELLSNINNHATPEEKTDIKRRLEDIERSVSEAINDSDIDSLVTRKQLIDSLQRTQRLIVFMTNIDVRSSLTVEQIVPVTLTKEERIVKAKNLANKTVALITLTESVIGVNSTSTASTTSASSTKEVLAKLLPAMKESKVSAEAVLATLEQPDYDLSSLEDKVKAYAMADDSATLLNVDRSALSEIKEEVVVPVDIASSTPVVSGSETGTSTVVEMEV
ncbi:MAG: hypothetical protein R3B53_00395 [Candidatus Paceibacterota bacterium]